MRMKIYIDLSYNSIPFSFSATLCLLLLMHIQCINYMDLSHKINIQMLFLISKFVFIYKTQLQNIDL